MSCAARFQPQCAAAFPAIFLDPLDAAELQTSETAGFVLGNAGPHLVGNLRLEVESQFFVQVDLHSLVLPLKGLPPGGKRRSI